MKFMTAWVRSGPAWAPLFFLAGLASAESTQAAQPERLLRSSAEEAVVEIAPPLPVVQAAPGSGEVTLSVNDWTCPFPPGAPELPTTEFQVALPPGTRPVLSVRVLASTFLPVGTPRPVPHYTIHDGPDGLPSQDATWERDDAAYSREYPTDWARLGEPGYLRHLRVVSVQVFPYRWDPQARGLQVATRLEVQVRFEPEGAAAARSRVRMVAPAAPEKPVWTRLYDQAVLNAGEAKAWLRTPAQWRNLPREKSLPPVPEFRITVDHSDLYRITGEQLVQAQWDPLATPLPLDRLALVERFFVETDSVNPFHEEPVPMFVRDLSPGGPNGQFDRGDDLFFFGLTAWDRLHPQPKDRRYGRVNAYFLTLRDEGGALMDTAASFLNLENLIPETSFSWTDRMEGDGVYMKPVANGEAPPNSGYLLLGVDGIRKEHFLWFGGGYGQQQRTFDLPGLQALLGLRVALQGITRPVPDPFDAEVTFRVRSSGGSYTALPGPVTVPIKSSRMYSLTQNDLQGITLGSSGNSFQMEMPSDGYGAAVDWFEWSYLRAFRAAQNRLSWSTNALAGPREFRASGFGVSGGGGLLLFDLTDSVRTVTSSGPRRLTLRPEQIRGDTLRVQLDLGEGTAPRKLLGLTVSAAAAPVGIEKTSSDDLATPLGGDEELIVIAPSEFMPGLAPLLAKRQEEGLSVRAVAIRDVFDQFNGGRAWPTAIRNYLRFLFRNRAAAPSFLLLAGDGSEDFAGVLPQSSPNFVPTQTVFSWAASSQGSELVWSDEWFVDDLEGTGERLDYRPDMHVGRLPAGSTAEVDLLVSKLLFYGDFQDSDTWRSRGLFVSDDEFSGEISFSSNTYYWKGDRPGRRNNESRFRWAAWECRKIIQEEAGFPEFAADTFFTASYMDTAACLQRCCPPDSTSSCWPCRFVNGDLPCFNRVPVPYATNPTDPETDNYDYGKDRVRPLLRQAMSRGHLFVNYEGHANAHLMAHEYLFQDFSFEQDSERLQNLDKPFFFMGYGCHLADFSAPDERTGNGDCLAEKLLLLDRNRGAIAALASTGYEWVYVNDLLNIGLFRSWFLTPPQVEGRSRWLLGEIMTGGKWLLSAKSSDDARGQIATYSLLGDPSMPMEMAPPRMSVWVNCDSDNPADCEPWVEGQPVEAAPGDDRLRIQARLRDEVHLGEVSLFERGQPVPDSLFTVDPDPDRPQDDRRRLLSYTTRLSPPLEDYDIEIRAIDGSGRQRSENLRVQLGNRFLVVREGTPREIRPTDILAGGDTVLVEVQSPVDLHADSLDLWMDDAPLHGLTFTSLTTRQWQVRGTLPLEISEAQHLLRLRIQRRTGGVAERRAEFQGATVGSVRLLEVYNFPNPFGPKTEFHFRLNGEAAGARLSVFTLSGRKIWHAESAARVNDNIIRWDGRDEDGDPVANGVYFYKLEVRTLDGRSLNRIERLARIQ